MTDSPSAPNSVHTELAQANRQPQADLDERPHLGVAPQESEADFAAVFQALPHLMIITRLRDDVVVAANEATVNQTGYSQEELLGHSVAKELAIWVDPAGRERLLASLQQDGRVAGQEYLFRTKDGTIWHAQLSARLIRFGGEECMLASVRDITDRVRAERARDKAEAALRESEARYRRLAEENARLLDQSQKDAAALSCLLNEVNHRVKNNLVAILGLLQMELAYPRTEDWALYQGMVQDLSARIQSLLLVHNLLSVAAEAPLPLPRLAANVMGVAPAMLPRQHTPVEMEISPLPVPLSPQQAHALGLILNELVTNSLKHAADEDQPIRLSLDTSQAGREVSLVYRDNGPGFPAEVLRGERQSVGLYLVRALAESDLEGKLELSNDRGAKVRLTFNLAEDMEDIVRPPKPIG